MIIKVMFKKLFFIFFIFFIFLFAGNIFSQNAIDITNQMFEKAKAVKSMSFYIVAKERFGTEYKLQKAFIKKQISPTRIYYKQLLPATGAEVLINTTHNKKALVNPNAFPWTNLSLDPYGKILRDAQHHNIYEAGFDYLTDILSYLTNKYKDNIDKIVSYKGIVDWQGSSCYKIEFNHPSFKIYPFTTTETCTPTSLAKKLRIGDYLIIERNPKYKEYLDVIKIGTVLSLPNDYAKRLVILINKSSYLPVYMEIYDDKGLLEQYQFTEINTNPGFTEIDFSEKNESYGFK
jgi:outer membrane lipoprotein-sorting protein